MQVNRIPFDQVSQFSARDIAYATQKPELKPFYKYPVSIDAFTSVIADRQKTEVPRALLVDVLREQHQDYSDALNVQAEIDSLLDENTFTIVTAHQPSLFTGPLYYIYKIISALRLAKELNQHYPDYHIVPIFISGGEDHDFEEINHLHIFGKTLEWQNDESGPVARMHTDSLKPVLRELEDILGDSPQAKALFEKIEGIYTKHQRYGRAALAFTHELFKDLGLVVLDMSHPKLKEAFRPVLREELMEQPSNTLVEETVSQLTDLGYKMQAFPREINLFYLQDQSRERIVRSNGTFEVLNTPIKFSVSEMETEIEAHPERFSPNVVTRPLFQEFILPNLAYIGGGGELAYWLERKKQFEHFGINFPMLIRRNSVLWIDPTSSKKMQKTDVRVSDLFRDTEELLQSFVKENTDEEISLKMEKKALAEVWQEVVKKAIEVDPSLSKAAKAEQAKAMNSLNQLEGKLMRAEKKKHDIALNQIRSIKDRLFPKNGLQERYDNFIPFYLRYGNDFFETLLQELNPLEKGLVVIHDEA